FLNIWLKASSYKTDRGEPRAWIMSVAHHKLVDVIRARRRTLAATDPDGYETLELLPSAQISTEEEVERKIERERILKAVATLPPPQRQGIMMAYPSAGHAAAESKSYGGRCHLERFPRVCPAGWPGRNLSVLPQRFVRYTTVLRGFRLGARRAVMLEHHKGRATTSGGLARPPFGSLFPSPRGVGKAFRWAAIACASPPAEETGKAIVWVQFN
ncbi:MAG: RNA polymerase sigma factor, partial [Rhodospirillales bacterium]